MVTNLQACTYNDAWSQIANCMRAHWTGYYRDWYIGVTADPQRRVYSEHNVDPRDLTLVVCYCINEQTARDIEQAFLKAGCDGGGGGGGNTRYVYVYKKNRQTRQ